MLLLELMTAVFAVSFDEWYADVVTLNAIHSPINFFK